MAEEIKHLLDRIQKDGVEKAQEQAKAIVAEAQAEARRIVDEGRRQADEMRKQSERDAEKFRESARRALEQSGRDVLISVGKGIEALLNQCVMREVGKALTADALKEMLARMSAIYLEANLGEGKQTLELSQQDKDALTAFFDEKLREMLDKGLDIQVNPRIQKGYRLSIRDKNLYHDFTQQAIADEMGAFLQPELQKIVQTVIADQKGN